jgi:hypothetical protein
MREMFNRLFDFEIVSKLSNYSNYNDRILFIRKKKDWYLEQGCDSQIIARIDNLIEKCKDEFQSINNYNDSHYQDSMEKSNLLTINKNRKKDKPEKLFHEFLNHNKKENFAKVCKELFNANNSPKDYAIMLCLLSEEGIVTIPNRGRSSFFSAWYKYIDKILPKNKNFYAINKFIDDKSGNGFVFKDESDQDYCFIKNNLNKKIHGKPE